MSDAMLQIASTIGFLLSVLGFVYFMKSRSVAKVLATKAGANDNTVAPPPLTGAKSWWGKKNKNAQMWFLYAVNSIISIILASVVPHVLNMFSVGYPEWIGIVVGGAFFWLVCHLYIWPVYVEETSAGTKIFVILTAIFFLFAVTVPNATMRAVKKAEGMREHIDQHAFTSSKTEVTSQGTPSAPLTVRQLVQPMILFPGDDFQKVNIPLAKRIDNISFSCAVPGTKGKESNGCIVRILHRGNLICNSGIFQGADCGYEVVDNGGRVPIFDEQFKLGKDPKVAFPNDLIQVTYMVATTSEFGPVEAKVTTVISD